MLFHRAFGETEARGDLALGQAVKLAQRENLPAAFGQRLDGSVQELEFLVTVPTVPVVSVDHPLAREHGPLSRGLMEEQVQLILTDRTPLTRGLGGSGSRGPDASTPCPCPTAC